MSKHRKRHYANESSEFCRNSDNVKYNNPPKNSADERRREKEIEQECEQILDDIGVPRGPDGDFVGI